MSHPSDTPPLAQPLPQRPRIARALRRATATMTRPTAQQVEAPNSHAHVAQEKLRQQARTPPRPPQSAPSRDDVGTKGGAPITPVFSRPFQSQATGQSKELLPRAGEGLYEQPSNASSADNSTEDMVMLKAVKAGIALHRYHEVQPDPNVPPGSQYPSWMWDALDRDGYITVELHVQKDFIQRSLDTERITRSTGREAWHGESEQDKRERQKEGKRLPTIGELHPLPIKQELHHCLIQIPEPAGVSRWGGAKRVLFVPQTYEYQRMMTEREELYAYNQQARRSNQQGPQRIPHAIAAWNPLPSAIKHWLQPAIPSSSEPSALHQMIIAGCSITASPIDRTPENYWLVLSRNDARRYVQTTLHKDPAIENSKALARWLGELHLEGLHQAMIHALNQHGAIAPFHWDEEDRAWWKEENAKWQAQLRDQQTPAPTADDPNAILAPMPAPKPNRPKM